ncbi:hypothetical protein LDENG_00118880 [Lucifuga dentata]|nr:hypothetical protein LDENG_00118880 [Lucifuga dentata]
MLFYLVLLYQPPGPYSQFLEEFCVFISDLTIYAERILILGDFNIHVNKPSDPLSKTSCLEILEIFGFTQHYRKPHTAMEIPLV